MPEQENQQGDNYREQISGTAPQGSGIFKSVDGGLNWDTIATTAFEGTVCSQIVIDPVNTDNIYVATGGGNILKSTDAGGSMEEGPVSATPVYPLRLIPSIP